MEKSKNCQGKVTASSKSMEEKASEQMKKSSQKEDSGVRAIGGA
jgi:hypothetical protein